MTTRADFELTYAHGDSLDVSALLFPFVGQNLLIGPDAELPRPEDMQALGKPLQTFRFGTLAGQECVLKIWPKGRGGIPLRGGVPKGRGDIPLRGGVARSDGVVEGVGQSDEVALPEGLSTGDFRTLWGQWPEDRLAALVRARQLAVWVLHNLFCGACGQPMKLDAAEIACVCPGCGYKAYPRISPVAIGLVIKGEELLLARSVRAPRFAPGMYSALAGFVEAGESAEECLCREVREEAGIEIHNLRYFGSQSWPYPHSLMIGFIADYHSGKLVAQKDEIEDLGWFRLDDLPILPHPASLARRMIEFVRAQRHAG